MPSFSVATWAAMTLPLSPSVRARKASAPSAPDRRSVSSSVPSPRTALPWNSADRRAQARGGRPPNREPPADPLPVGETEHEQVGATLGRLVDEGGPDIAGLEEDGL